LPFFLPPVQYGSLVWLLQNPSLLSSVPHAKRSADVSQSRAGTRVNFFRVNSEPAKGRVYFVKDRFRFVSLSDAGERRGDPCRAGQSQYAQDRLLYEAFAPEEAHALTRKPEFHYTFMFRMQSCLQLPVLIDGTRLRYHQAESGRQNNMCGEQ
jgi:hypothetical protein